MEDRKTNHYREAASAASAAPREEAWQVLDKMLVVRREKQRSQYVAKLVAATFAGMLAFTGIRYSKEAGQFFTPEKNAIALTYLDEGSMQGEQGIYSRNDLDRLRKAYVLLSKKQ